MAVAKYYEFQCRSIFSTEESFGYVGLATKAQNAALLERKGAERKPWP